MVIHLHMHMHPSHTLRGSQARVYLVPVLSPLNRCNSGSPQNQPGTVQLRYKKKILHFDPLLHLIRGGVHTFKIFAVRLTI